MGETWETLLDPIDTWAPSAALALLPVVQPAWPPRSVLEKAFGARLSDAEPSLGELCSRVGLHTGRPSGAASMLLTTTLAEVGAVLPALESSIRNLVHVVYVVTAEGPAFDTSFSDPQLPHAVFLSIPPPSPTQAPRLAESLVHETFHLQLSLIERRGGPLVDRERIVSSPWRAGKRTVAGLLHSIYVFSGLHQFWRLIASFEEHPWNSFARDRSGTIPGELETALSTLEVGATSSLGVRVVSLGRHVLATMT